jgi:hypothetical protein
MNFKPKSNTVIGIKPALPWCPKKRPISSTISAGRSTAKSSGGSWPKTLSRSPLRPMRPSAGPATIIANSSLDDMLIPSIETELIYDNRYGQPPLVGEWIHDGTLQRETYVLRISPDIRRRNTVEHSTAFRVGQWCRPGRTGRSAREDPDKPPCQRS